MPFSLPLLFLTFLKIGSVLYGSGYVLLAFLRADFVVQYGWLTDQQLLDAIAIGQVTPGPVFTTATFIGYLLGGAPGAVAGDGGHLPAGLRLRGHLQPVDPADAQLGLGWRPAGWGECSALGLMGGVTWQLGRSSIVDPLTALIAVVSLVLLVRFKVNSTWLIAGGALIGLLSAALR